MLSHSTTFFAIALFGFAALFATPSSDLSPSENTPTKPVSQAASGAALVDCLVYRVSSSELLKTIEDATGRTTSDPDAIFKIVTAATSGATRLARVHAPISLGTETTFKSTKQVPTVTVNQGAFSDQTSFSGWQQSSSHLSFLTDRSDNGLRTTYSIQVEEFAGAKSRSKATPPPRDRVALHGATVAASGMTRMYQLEAGDKKGGAILIFVTVSNL